MKLKVGDKVKFLNESGGGIVSKIIDHSIVNVSVEEGFDIPYLINDLLLIKSDNQSENLIDENDQRGLNSKTNIQPQEINFNSTNTQYKKISKAKEKQGIYLVFVPQDQKWFITGQLDIYIANHCPYDILYSLSLKNDEGYYGFDYGSVPPEASVLLGRVEREQLNNWNEGIVQLIYHMDREKQVLLPVHSSFKIKQNKWNDEKSYQSNGLIDYKAFIINLNDIEYHKKAKTVFGIENEIIKQKAMEKKVKALIDKHQTLPKIAEVDLHIGELLDNIFGMESWDIFAYQKKYFKDCLDSAIENNYKKVVFIHGVGNGRLKNAIIDTLKQYEDVENQSASISKYGVGAIEVLIKPWT